ncbi:MAG: hypothetical protein JXP34_18690 [Planctomycetes bacterium]|nr:hypothetical protein [Planctomycetota bacterium]
MLWIALILAAPDLLVQIPPGPLLILPGEKGLATVVVRRGAGEGFEVIWERAGTKRHLWGQTALWSDAPQGVGGLPRAHKGVPMNRVPAGVDPDTWVDAIVAFGLCRFDEAGRTLQGIRQDGLGAEAKARIEALLAGCTRGKADLAPFLAVKRASEARPLLEKAHQVYRALHDTDLGLPAFLAYRHVKDLLFRDVADFEIGQTKEYVRPQGIIEIVSEPVFEGVHARSLFNGGGARDWETIIPPGISDWTPHRELSFRARTKAGASRSTYKVTLDVHTDPDGPEYLVSRRSLRFDGSWRLYRFDIRKEFYAAKEMAGHGAFNTNQGERALAQVFGIIFVRLEEGGEEPIFVDDIRLAPVRSSERR